MRDVRIGLELPVNTSLAATQKLFPRDIAPTSTVNQGNTVSLASSITLALSLSTPTMTVTTPPVVGQVVKFNSGFYAVAGMAGVGGGGTAAYTDTTVSPNITYQINTNLALFLNSQFPGNNAVLSGVFTSLHATLFQQAGQGLFSFDGSMNDPIYVAYMAAQGAWRKARGIAKGDQCRFGFAVGWAVNTGAGNDTAALAKTFDFAGSAGVVPPYIRDCAKNGQTLANYQGSGKTVGYADIYNNVGYAPQANGATVWNPGGATTRCYFGIQVSKSGLCGHAYTGYLGGTGGKYLTVYPTTWEIGVEKDRANTLFALSVYKLPYTDSSGTVTWYTLDRHPLIEYLWFLDETSADINISESSMVPVSIDSGVYPNGNLCCATGYWNAKYDMYGVLSAQFPTTEWGDALNFQFKAGRSDDDTNTSYNTRLPYIAANWKNISLAGPDVYGNSWGSAPQATTAQQAFVGIPSPSNTSLGTINPAASLQGIMDVVAQIEDLDWDNHIIGGHGNYSTQTGADILAAGCGNGNAPGKLTLCASRVLAWNTTDRFLTSDWANPIYASLVAAASATPPNSVRPVNIGGAVPVFNFPALPVSQMNAVWEAANAGSSILLTQNVNAHQAGASWYTPAKVPVTSFTASFTFQQTTLTSSTQMCCFVIQNSTVAAASGSNAFGTNATADANLGGYGAYSFQTPITKSVGIKFDMSGANGQNNYPSGVNPQATGLYINGGNAGGLVPDIDLNPSTLNLHLGNPMLCTLVYDGTLLTMVLKDTVTGHQFRQAWPVNIPACVGGNTAWVGLTGGNVTPAAAQSYKTISYSAGYAPRLSTPIFSVAPGQYAATQSVSISATSTASIYYTTNGQAPTSSSTLYSGPISISTDTVLQAVAIEAGLTDSLVALGNYQIASSGTPLVNFPSGFASSASLIALNGSAQLSGGSIILTDATNPQEAASAFYVAPVPINSFTWKTQIQGGAGTTNGMTLCIQNQPAAALDGSILHVSGGPNIVGVNFGFGYSGSTNGSGGSIAGILASVAVKLDFNNNSTGVYLNGAQPTTPQTALGGGVSLTSGDAFDVTAAYSSTTQVLTVTVTDHGTPSKTTTATFTNLNIAAAVGGSTAYIGVTAGTGFNAGLQKINSMTFSTP